MVNHDRLPAKHEKDKRRNHAVISNHAIVRIKRFWQQLHVEIIGQDFQTQQSQDEDRLTFQRAVFPLGLQRS